MALDYLKKASVLKNGLTPSTSNTLEFGDVDFDNSNTNSKQKLFVVR
jgi:hypothetical protein